MWLKKYISGSKSAALFQFHLIARTDLDLLSYIVWISLIHFVDDHVSLWKVQQCHCHKKYFFNCRSSARHVSTFMSAATRLRKSEYKTVFLLEELIQTHKMPHLRKIRCDYFYICIKPNNLEHILNKQTKNTNTPGQPGLFILVNLEKRAGSDLLFLPIY